MNKRVILSSLELFLDDKGQVLIDKATVNPDDLLKEIKVLKADGMSTEDGYILVALLKVVNEGFRDIEGKVDILLRTIE